MEIGCGRGKNTDWLITKAKQITSVDLSNKIPAKAKTKKYSKNIDTAYEEKITGHLSVKLK